VLLVNTFDVEPWWTTIPPCVDRAVWGDMPDRSEKPLYHYLDLCDQAGVKCTFFLIGWYAQRFPSRVLEIVRRGHEVGCHSLFHEDVNTLSFTDFFRTTKEAKNILEDVIGGEVLSYRAPSFSFSPKRCSDLLAQLFDLGFRIDSSISTARRIVGGGYSGSDFSYPRSTKDICGVDIFEIPVPGVKILGNEIQVFGGGYLRLTPRYFINHLVRQESYQVLYLHPHDFDINSPSLPNSSLIQNLRRKLNIGDLSLKVKDIFALSDVKSCYQMYSNTRSY
jgi:polysaccharide deacetylase family protein (PEP-CTERM system associated)